MGANFNTRTFKADLDRQEVVKRWNDMVAMSLHENGHSYSGEIGMLGNGIDFKEEAFATENQADEFLTENQQKWDRAMAVRFLDRQAVEWWLVGGWCSS